MHYQDIGDRARFFGTGTITELSKYVVILCYGLMDGQGVCQSVVKRL